MFAMLYGHMNIIKLLLKYNANPYIKNIFGETALNIASKEGYIKIIGPYYFYIIHYPLFLWFNIS